MNRDGLIESIRLYLPFDDISAHIDTWIEPAEAKFRRDIRIREMQAQERFVLGSVDLSSAAASKQGAASENVSTLSTSARGKNTANVYVTSGDAVNFPAGTVLSIPLVDGSTFSPTVTSSLASLHFDVLYLSSGFPATGQQLSMEAGVTITGVTPGSSVAPTGPGFDLVDPAEIDLPTGFLEIIDIYETGSSGGVLEYIPPKKFWSLDVARSGTGQPAFYTILGDSIVFAPASSASRDYVLDYFKALDAITTENATNTLLTNSPDVYLYAVLAEAYRYLADDKGASEAEGRYLASVSALHATDSRSRHRPGGRIRSDVTTDGAFRI